MIERVSDFYINISFYMVWAHSEINRTCKDDPTGYGTRREKERQTEKEM